MQYVNLGRTGLKVSRLCLGTINFGPHTPEPDAFQIMDRAHDAGINFFDTADVYGRHLGKGTTEQIVGRWLAQGGHRREKTVLATKLYAEMDEWPNHGRLSALWIKRACENSLRRLQTDYIDLYQMHHVDRDTPWDEIWQAFEQLTREGKIIYAGSSNFAAWDIVQANETARRRDFLGLVSEQSRYNLLFRHLELEVLPACQHYGVAVLPWQPLCGGALAGGVAQARDGRRAFHLTRGVYEKHTARIEAYERYCAEIDWHPADLALAWQLRNPAITAPVVGPRTTEQLDKTLRVLEMTVPDEVVSKLDEILPGPGGAAPDAYIM